MGCAKVADQFAPGLGPPLRLERRIWQVVHCITERVGWRVRLPTNGS